MLKIIESTTGNEIIIKKIVRPLEIVLSKIANKETIKEMTEIIGYKKFIIIPLSKSITFSGKGGVYARKVIP